MTCIVPDIYVSGFSGHFKIHSVGQSVLTSVKSRQVVRARVKLWKDVLLKTIDVFIQSFFLELKVQSCLPTTN